MRGRPASFRVRSPTTRSTATCRSSASTRASDPTAPDDYRPEVDHAPERVAAAFIALAEAPPGPVLVHCHGGRDRTGILAAIALSVAGAAHEAIVADYTLTEGTEAKTMQDLLDHFEAEHGGAAAYLTNAGVAPHHLAAVRDRLGADNR